MKKYSPEWVKAETEKTKTDREALWANSTTGDEFQCLHVDDAREMECLLREARDMLHKESLGNLFDPSFEMLVEKIDTYLNT